MLPTDSAGDHVAWLDAARGSPPAPPPLRVTLRAGQMRVAVGGRSLMVECHGTGEPVVVLDAPLGSDSSTWIGVQQILARRHRVCRYDRAGLGASDPAPPPRDARAAAADLGRVVRALKPQPVILVGASFGGFVAQLYAIDLARLSATSELWVARRARDSAYPRPAPGYREVAALPRPGAAACRSGRRRVTDLGDHLRALGSATEPDVPDIASRVLRRIVDEDQPDVAAPVAQSWLAARRRRLLVGVAVAVAVVVPVSIAAVARWAIGGAEVRRVAVLPSASEQALDVYGGPTTLVDARRTVEFAILVPPADILPPPTQVRTRRSNR